MSFTGFKKIADARDHARKFCAPTMPMAVIKVKIDASGPFGCDWRGYQVLPLRDLAHCDRPVFVAYSPITKVLEAMRATGARFSHRNGEWLVNIPGGTVATCYVTDDAADAIQTAKVMMGRYKNEQARIAAEVN